MAETNETETTPVNSERDQEVVSIGRTLIAYGKELLSTSQSNDELESLAQSLETVLEEIGELLGR